MEKWWHSFGYQRRLKLVKVIFIHIIIMWWITKNRCTIKIWKYRRSWHTCYSLLAKKYWGKLIYENWGWIPQFKGLKNKNWVWLGKDPSWCFSIVLIFVDMLSMCVFFLRIIYIKRIHEAFEFIKTWVFMNLSIKSQMKGL